MNEHERALRRSILSGIDGEQDERSLAREALGVPQLEVRHVQRLELRAEEAEEGTFDGYACVWDVVDSYGTSFRRGCFSAGGLDGLAYALLWMHQPWEPGGIFYASEDDHGLRIAGRWDTTSLGGDMRVRAQSGSAPGLSVGFVPLGTDPDDSSVFTVCRLVETSQITARMAAVPGAALVGVRSQVDPVERFDAEVQAGAVAARLRLLAVHSQQSAGR